MVGGSEESYIDTIYDNVSLNRHLTRDIPNTKQDLVIRPLAGKFSCGVPVGWGWGEEAARWLLYSTACIAIKGTPYCTHNVYACASCHLRN